MARFNAPLKVEKRLYKEKVKFLWLIPYQRQRQFWITTAPFSLIRDDGSIIASVPSGFPTDFSSVPIVVRSLFPKDDVDSQAAALHDYLYHTNKPSNYHSSPIKPEKSRMQCDDIFLIGMIACDQTLSKREIKYRAVRLFGWYGWNKKDKEISNAT